jgi:hypothetical protein
MAAITPTTVNRFNIGNANLLVATFTTSSDGDTWASGIGAISGKWTDHNANPTTQASVGIASTFSGGTFTFYPAENSAPFVLYAIIE